MPKTVKGAFIHQETGNRTTVYFTRGVGNAWTGEVTFATSGEYCMDYLELDGEYTGLPESQHITINLYLGLSASVYAGDTNFALESGESRDVPMSLIIRTDSGSIIGDLDNVWLQYSNNGSGTQELGVGAKMVWNAEREMYEGAFHLTHAGIYNYHYVQISLPGETSTLSAAVTSPTITAISSNPPKYVSKMGFGEVFALNNSAKFTVRMKNADSATVDAALKNEAGDVYYVRGTMADEGAEQVFTFVLPIFDGVQSGNWTLEKLYMTNIYGGKDNILYDGSTDNGPDTATETKPLYTVANNYYHKWLEWSIADLTNEGESEESTIRLVSNVNVSFTDSNGNASKDFGKTDGVVTATFGTVHQLGDLELEVTAGNDRKPLSEYGMSVTGVELKYNYDQTCVPAAVGGIVTNQYGGYTIDSNSWTNLTSVANTEHIYNVIVSASGTNVVIGTNKKNMSVAGRYKAVGQMVLTIADENGNTTTINIGVKDLNAPTYTVWSNKMAVAIDSIAPATGRTYTTINNNKDKEISKTSKLSGNTAEVYCEIKKNGNGFEILTYPYVDLKLLNKSSVGEITMTFTESGGGTVYLYEGERSNRNSSYEWSNSDVCRRYVGDFKTTGLCSSSTVDGAGTLTSSQITISHDGFTYTMNVDEITIKNPDL